MDRFKFLENEIYNGEKKIIDFKAGDTIKVYTKFKEGDKARIQQFEGVVIGIRGCGINTNITVRKTSYGVGVERIFPIYSPSIDKIEIVQKTKVRRAKLYYLRGLSTKSSRLQREQKLQSQVTDTTVKESNDNPS